ncbi:MAG: hypothetical protein ACKOUK_09515 [Verrucomicrobiota bacterium]
MSLTATSTRPGETSSVTSMRAGLPWLTAFRSSSRWAIITARRIAGGAALPASAGLTRFTNSPAIPAASR